MTVSQWPSNVNTRFYSGNDKPLENTEEVSFLSGRRVAWQINTKKLMSFKSSFSLLIQSLLISGLGLMILWGRPLDALPVLQ